MFFILFLGMLYGFKESVTKCDRLFILFYNKVQCSFIVTGLGIGIHTC